MGAELRAGFILVFSALWPLASTPDILFNNPYPIGRNPQMSGTWVFANPADELILFEAEPILRLSIYNDIYRTFLEENANRSQAWYIAYRPHLRMYTDNSVPVKMPSYRILPATQHLWQLDSPPKKFKIIGFSVESGHYSNGQSGCAYGSTGDRDSVCNEIYSNLGDDSDLSRILNRTDGEFSTNMTEIVGGFQFGSVDDDDRQSSMHAFTLRTILFHDRFWGLFPFGGFSDEDIGIYGRLTGGLNYEYSNSFDFTKQSASKFFDCFLSMIRAVKRYQVELDFEGILFAHSHVNPLRGGASFSWFGGSNMGGFVGLYRGHDNYNLRFVDDFPLQLKGGITWDISPALQFHHSKAE